MDEETLKSRIAAANDKFVLDDGDLIEDNHAEEEQQLFPRPAVDIYNLMDQSRVRESRRQRPNGASPKIKNEVDYVVNGFHGNGLKTAYNKAKAQAESLAQRGDTLRAKAILDQYMGESYMPAVEALVRLTSADQVINSADAMKELDALVLTSGGNPSGFTRSFVEQLYQQDLGTTEPSSDAYIKDTVRRISGLVNSDQIRTAVGLASRTLVQIENGEHSADDSDYELLQKVAERGQ